MSDRVDPDGEGEPFESASVFILINALFINNGSDGSPNEAHKAARTMPQQT